MTTPGPMLTERDKNIIYDVYSYRYMTTAQIQRLHFSSLQMTNRRIKKLELVGYIDHFTVPHVPGHIYYLSQKGKRLLALILNLSPSELKHYGDCTPKKLYFLDHFIQINDFRVSLSLACRNSKVELADFLPEYQGRGDSDIRPTKYIRDSVAEYYNPKSEISHTPDAVFALSNNLSNNKKLKLFFLEIDRGTEVIGNDQKGVLKCINFYLNYLASKKYQRYQQDFNSNSEFQGFKVLIVTTSISRVLNIRKVITDIPFDERAKKFILLTEFCNISPEYLFQPIWLSGSINDSTPYSIIGTKYNQAFNP